MLSVLGRSAGSLSGPGCLRTSASAAWGRSSSQSHQVADARSGPRHSCQITDRRAPILRRKRPLLAVPSCVSRAHWSRSTILVGQFTTHLD